MTSADLARNSFVRAQTMAQMVVDLEAKGHLSREVDERSRRRMLLTLTPLAESVLDALREPVAEIEAEMVRGLGVRERETFRKALQVSAGRWGRHRRAERVRVVGCAGAPLRPRRDRPPRRARQLARGRRGDGGPAAAGGGPPARREPPHDPRLARRAGVGPGGGPSLGRRHGGRFRADPTDPRHGSANGYRNLRCRCEACTGAWTAYQRDRRG